MLKDAYLDAKIGVDPAENDPRKECYTSYARRQMFGGMRTTRRLENRTSFAHEVHCELESPHGSVVIEGAALLHGRCALGEEREGIKSF